MNFATKDNPLCTWYRNAKRCAIKRGSPIYEEWMNWRSFAKWCAEHGYDENSKLHYSSHNPFTPEYLGIERGLIYDCEYIAFDAKDPYELIIASAPTAIELSNILKRMGYDYDRESILSALSRNDVERPIEERERGLLFEKIDLSNYNEDGEPFEERN